MKDSDLRLALLVLFAVGLACWGVWVIAFNMFTSIIHA